MVRKITFTILIMSALEALTGTIYTLLIPADPKNSLILGYSLPRLGVVALLLLAFAVSTVAAWKAHNGQGVERFITNLSGSGLAAVIFLLCLKFFSAGLAANLWEKTVLDEKLLSYFIRLQPLILWVMLASLQVATGLFYMAAQLSGPEDHRIFPKFARGLWHLGSLSVRLIETTFGKGEPLSPQSRWLIILTWFGLPIGIMLIYILSAAIPIVYVLTLVLYYPLAGLLLRASQPKTALIILAAASFCILMARLSPLTSNLNGKDETILSIFDVPAGESIEQDFSITQDDWRLQRLLDDPDIYAVLRLLGNFDADSTHLFINGKDLGTLKPLLASEPQGPFSGNPVSNYILKIPKDTLRGKDIVTIRLTSSQAFQAAYSSGIHPLPETTHSRLIKPDGTVEDLSDRFYHRRFRFQNGIYLVSDKYFTSQGSPLVFGTIL